MSIEKSKRNKKIYLLSKKGGGSLSVRQIQRRFKMKAVKTVSNIIKREHGK